MHNPKQPLAPLEAFVDATAAALHIACTRRQLLELVRAGQLPGHALGAGTRKSWRFKLTELSAAISAGKGQRK